MWNSESRWTNAVASAATRLTAQSPSASSWTPPSCAAAPPGQRSISASSVAIAAAGSGSRTKSERW